MTTWIAAPRTAVAQASKDKSAFYSGVGGELTHYEVDFDGAALAQRGAVKLPGGIHFQPSEWVKLILIIAVARFFARYIGRPLTWPDIFKAFVLVGLPLLLVLKQPDLGTALTYTPILLCGLFLGGIRWRQAVVLALAADQ